MENDEKDEKEKSKSDVQMVAPGKVSLRMTIRLDDYNRDAFAIEGQGE